MKIDKDVRMNRQSTQDRINAVFLFVLLIAVSLFLGLLPTLSFGQSGFSDIPDVPPPPAKSSAKLFTAQPPAEQFPAISLQDPIEQSSQPLEPSAMTTFAAPAAKTSSEPASLDISSPSTLAPVPATPNSSFASSVNPAPANNKVSLPPNIPSTPSAAVTPLATDPPRFKEQRQTFTRTPPVTAQGLHSINPASSTVAATPLSGNSSKEPTMKELQERPELLRSVIDPNHPFARYFDSPKDPNSIIKGKPYTIAQLLEGTGAFGSRSQLLQTYWELAGLLVEYNIRCESERLIGPSQDPQQNLAINLLQQQRRAAEIEFVKKQWQLTELLKRTKGVSLSESDLPIPCDYPLFKRYETYADKIARTDRTKYLGHLIPIQEQLIDAKQRCCSTMFDMFQTIPPNSRQLIDILNQRTETFLDLAKAVIDYNKMIAEYTSETIAPSITGYRLVGALIELPKSDSAIPVPASQPTEQASPTVPRLSEMTRPADPQAMYAPQHLPIGKKHFLPINQQVVQASYVEPDQQVAPIEQLPQPLAPAPLIENQNPPVIQMTPSEEE